MRVSTPPITSLPVSALGCADSFSTCMAHAGAGTEKAPAASTSAVRMVSASDRIERAARIDRALSSDPDTLSPNNFQRTNMFAYKCDT